jgi:hypothetical protein
MASVLVATPCYGGSLTTGYFMSVMQTIMALTSGRPDVTLTFYTLSNESLVTRARNTCVAHFLAHPEYTHLFFVDADIEFSPEAFTRLLDSGRDVACGCYPQKVVRWEHVARHAAASEDLSAEALRNAGLNFNVTVHSGEGTVSRSVENGFVKVDYGATGFMLVRRQVFDRLRVAYPGLKYVNDTLDDPAARAHNWLFFDTMLDPLTRQYLSEDYAFCKRWRDIGGEIWADVVSPLTHIGTFRFEGCMQNLLRAPPPKAADPPAPPPA